MNAKLKSLLLDLSGLSDEQARIKTCEEYNRLYMDRHTYTCMIGERKTHDNQTVIFYEDRFEHAFNTSIEGAYSQLKKDKFDRNRAVRVRWIDEVIQGNIQGIEYYHIPTGHHRDRLGRIRIKRLYVLWEENYIVWLEPRKENEWKFSSAYVANKGYIRKITRGYFCKKISRD